MYYSGQPATRLHESQQTWSQVVRRSKKSTKGPLPQSAPVGKPQNHQGKVTGGRNRRVPRSAVVTITCNQGEYEDTIARTKISLSDLGIANLKIRRAVTGALALEVMGEDNATKANRLADELRTVLKDRPNVRIARPVKEAERIRNLEESISAAEIALAIATEGNCRSEDVKIGTKRMAPNGLWIVWVKCPLVVANILSRAGTVRIGWSTTRIEMLPERPLQCFRCLEWWHVRANCPNSNTDRSGRCYRCGEGGHKAKDCLAPPRCPLCTDLGLPSSHRTGSGACTPSWKRNTGGRLRNVNSRERTMDAPVPPSPPPMREEAVMGEPGEPTETSKRGGGPPASLEALTTTPSTQLTLTQDSTQLTLTQDLT